MMRLIRISTLHLLVLMACTAAVSAQPDSRVYRVGYLWVGTPDGKPSVRLPAFRDGMRERGYVEGKNLAIDVQDGRGEVARLGAAAASLVAAGVDVIVTQGTGSTVAAKQATGTIPIIFASASDPVGRGLVASLARPGGNVTGNAIEITSTKTYELLQEIAPKIRRVGLLFHAQNLPASYLPTFIADRTAAARAAGFDLVPLPVNAVDEVGSALAGLVKAGGEAVFFNTDTLLTIELRALLALALRYRLASVCTTPNAGQSGCLIDYGDDRDGAYRHAAVMVDKVLKGARPADLPVEQPTRFELIVNIRTAKTLGLDIPPSILARADQVIE